EAAFFRELLPILTVSVALRVLVKAADAQLRFTALGIDVHDGHLKLISHLEVLLQIRPALGPGLTRWDEPAGATPGGTFDAYLQPRDVRLDDLNLDAGIAGHLLRSLVG